MVISRVEVVVLGLVAEEPLYGYQLLERFAERGMEHWADVGRASVYQALHRLERGRFVAGRSIGRDDGPARRVYRITPSGRRRLLEGLEERTGGAGTAQSEAGVALGLGFALSPARLRQAIAARQAEVEEISRAVASERAALARGRGAGNHLARRMLDLQAAYLRAERAWLGGLRREAGRLRR